MTDMTASPAHTEDRVEPAAPSWEHIVRTQAAMVHRLAYRLTRNQHDAEDLTHDVFLRVFKYLASYAAGRGSFESWIYRITVNAYLDEVRRKQRLRMVSLPPDAEQVGGREASPADVHLERVLDGEVRAALDALQPASARP